MLPSGATTVSCGPPDREGGVPYTLASQPATTVTTATAIALTISSVDGRRCMALLVKGV
jgi:hypothetical protein